MTWAADAAGQPNPQALKDAGCTFVGQYVGTAYQHYGVPRWYIDQCHILGLGVLLILEEWSSQFLGGYDAARQMMARMEDGWRELGAPTDGSVIPAIVVVDPNPNAVPGHEGELSAFVRGIEDALWTPEWTGYGSLYGLQVASGVAKKMTRRWGVGTWGFGESSNGALPASTHLIAEMIQHGNVAAPVEDVDYNTVFRPDMGQWGGATVSAPTKEHFDMDALLADVGNGQSRIVVKSGPQVLVDLTGAKDPTYGVPSAELNYLGVDLGGVKVMAVPPGKCDEAVLMHASALAAPASGPCPPGLDDAPNAALINELTSRLT